jgi:hypothetical protein
MKHNKKRNTAFLYEALVKELTKCIVNKNNDEKNVIVSILKEHFSKNKILHTELSLYKAIHESRELNKNIAEKILFESRMEYEKLSREEIFKEQSRVIQKINKSLSSNVFANFVPDYKSLATISQVFTGSLPVKERVLLEESVLDNMCKEKEKINEEKMVPVDQLAFKVFMKKFNDKYGTNLMSEQKELLTNYVLSFSDNGLGLKVFLNEELGRLKEETNKCLMLNEIKQNSTLFGHTNKILKKLELFKEKQFNQEMLGELLKIQHFVSEAQADGE